MGSPISISRRGLMLVLSAPSGTGKTTLAKMLKQSDEHILTSVSVTTRPRRAGEEDGIEYYFKERIEFERMQENGEFLEYAEVFGHMYGTPRSFVEKQLNAGQDVLFDIEWQGYRQLVATARPDVTGVFLLPPSKVELIERLNNRHVVVPEEAKKRFSYVDSEISHWHEYDYVVINRDLEESLAKLLAILRAERLRKERRTGLPAFIGSLMHEQVEQC